MDAALRVPPMTYTRNRSLWLLGAAIAASLLLAGIAQ
jgi:hypothetical protein